MALRNTDLNNEVWDIIKAQHWNLADLSDRLGIPQSNFYRILKREQIQSAFINLLDVLGYDVEVKFVRKRSRYTRPGVPDGLERLSKKQAEDLIEKLQTFVETKNEKKE